jgi:hypothetical protein
LPQANSTAIDCSDKFGERVLVIRLLEGHVLLGVAVVAEDVGDLFQNQDHADRGQQALDYAGRDKDGDEPGLSESQGYLNQPCKNHRQQKRRERSQGYDLSCNDRRHTGGRSTDAGVRSAQCPHQDPTHDPR